MQKTVQFEKLQQEWRIRLQRCFWWIVKINTSLEKTEQKKNRTFVYGAMGMCMIGVSFHGYLSWVFCIFIAPIIISVIFADKVLTWRAFWIGAIAMFISIFVCCLLDDVSLTYSLVVGVLNVSFMLIIYFVCKYIVAFLEQKNEIIKDYNDNNELLSFELALDSMTSLYNHEEFERELERDYGISKSERKVMTLIVADIDHFKSVNDTFGHDQGDKILLSVAHQLKDMCGKDGKAFRYGGEEFAAIFMNKTVEEVLPEMELLRNNISKTVFDFMPKDKNITISIGLYEFSSKDDISSDDIFSFVDSALYEAKSGGRNKCVVYNKL